MLEFTDVIAGRNPVAEALRAGRPINRILLSRNIQRHSIIAEIIRLCHEQGIPVEYIDDQAIRKYSAGVDQGVIALTAAKDYISLDKLLAIPKKKNESALFCVLDGLEDPQNLGAILRTADATGVHGIVVRTRRAVGLTPAVARVSAGAVEYVPVARVANIAQTLEDMKKAGVWIIGIDMHGDCEYAQVDYKMPLAIVIGGEGKGVSELVRKRCDILARIPMKGHIGSLNASVAAALVLYEAFRQRRS
ncbi:MAG: 23S rRNA (guanosine(2251)-2'-O)-methyltransferase RlmB [Dehalococcoidia bacterium]|nr:23S rRNA (guanosine(2251)-2'-O)-methyltransferase RlmB [Dehalococcoidia bacterium]